ncbi:hypothetical protein [Streptomyces djakartensis]|uniref:Peptidoglycan binding domain-containing protein n=1 Tax=Streptomyces djakartensis TaxID=68193 RepID=A0ABQ2Z1Y3_9ACTN|nr:hypothetical protein [Streptomyces djakartensis]GGY00939.1 hypothetical protein GCM10010384_00390 [Streptomyces djakartensis]
MSRETDTPSSGPNGRGGAAYPSGTPPYGIPAVSDGGTDAGRSAARPEERKTETTLTTRIRINIPGSRPIPPVVVRKPVTDAESTGDTGTRAEAPTPPGAATSRGMGSDAAEPPADSAQPADDKPASDWFAPRKSGPGKSGPGAGSTNGAGLPGGSGPAAGGTGTGAPGSAGAGASGGARPGAGRPGGVVGSMSVPGGSRSGGTNGSGLPGGATGGPVAPGHGGGTGSFDVTEALAAGPRGNGSRPAPGGGGGEPRRDDLPYFSDNGDGQNGQSGQNGQGGYGGPGAPNGFGETGGPGGPGSRGPAGPTGGPVTGNGPMVPSAGRSAPGGPGGPGRAGDFDEPGGPGTAGGPSAFQQTGGGPKGPAGSGSPGIFNGPGKPGTPGAPFDEPHRSSGPGAPSAPGAFTGPTGPGTATTGPGAAGTGGGMSDDTAILTPQKPAPEPPDGQGYGGPRHDNVSGHTVTSGIPVVPPGAASPFGPGASGDGPVPHTAPRLPEPASPAPASSTKAPKKKGRNKLVLLAAGVVVAAGGVYGAGLLMNRTDVPKGTTVLGVDIGGTTRDGAVKKLDEAFDGNVGKPLKLSVGGRTVSLDPDKAGLQFDMDATADAAAKSDYNPISVVGSLFGNHRVVTPVMPVDEEKLHASLENAAGGGGSASDGTIKFEGGKAVPVYGRTGKGVDIAKSTAAIEEAYRTQVETGAAGTVNLPTTTREPTVSNAEVDRVLKDFAQPAMSAKAIVQTDPAHSIPFGALSLPKILGFKAVDGKLVDTYDLQALKAAYGTTFDGVKIETATGKRDVLPQDVVTALRKALRGKTAAERTVVIDTKPN